MTELFNLFSNCFSWLFSLELMGKTYSIDFRLNEKAKCRDGSIIKVRGISRRDEDVQYSDQWSYII